MEGFEYSDEKKNALIEAIYIGVITLSSLPKGLYVQTANTLKKSLYKGYGGTLLDFEFGTTDHKILKELRDNIYMFSGAKTATQCMDMKSLMHDGEKILTLGEFKKVALQKFDTYNNAHLEVEYKTTLATADSAKVWRDAIKNKDLFPRMRSVCEMAPTSAPECIRMNNVVAPIESPIWYHNVHPRHFGCNCYEEKLDKYDKSPSTPKGELESIASANANEINDIFKNNANKSGRVWNSNHPYYDIGKAHPDLAKQNFNLPIPKKDAK